MVGLGRAVGAGADMVIFGIVGLGAGVAEIIKCIHLVALLDATDQLEAVLATTDALEATLGVADALGARLETQDALAAKLDVVDALGANIGEEC